MLSGHLLTLRGYLERSLEPPRPAPSRPWSTVVVDPRVGPVRLSGRLRQVDAAVGLVIVVHGLGGSADSPYVVAASLAAEAARLSSLRLNLRGADRRGEDFYHAGLTADLHAAFASPELRLCRRILILGYSLGGHLALRFATECVDPRLRAVAAIGSPLDLGRGADAIDRRDRWPYRFYLLRNLKQIYGEVARRRPVPTPYARARRISRLREWDELTVAPRYGFDSATDYYYRASVGPRIHALLRPSLLVAAEDDPMVPAGSLRRLLSPPPDRLEVCWLARGGHLGYAADADLGIAGPPGMDHQALSWLKQVSCSDPPP